jgi:hypothetical protein
MVLGSGIRKKPIPDPGVKKHPIPDPGSGSATLQSLSFHILPKMQQISSHWYRMMYGMCMCVRMYK